MSEAVDIWADRRVKIGYESAEELAKHYNSLNFRGHPENQRNATEESLDALGYVGQVKKSLRSGVVLDGHLRIEIALAKDPSIQLPVDYYDLTPDEELLALQVLDATTEMAEPIAGKLAALMERTRHLTADKPGLAGMLEQLKARAGVNGKQHKIGRAGRLYNAGEGHSIEPFKLAHRIEAAWQARGKKAIDLYSGQGQLAGWYRRRFETVITVDKSYHVGDVDYQMTAGEFIDQLLPGHLDFDFVDFDDEGTPARKIQKLFNAISGKKSGSFILALTDGNGLNIKFRGKLNFSEVYLVGDNEIRNATTKDYETFETIVTDFMVKCAEGAKFIPTILSSYRGREGNVVYQTWLIEPQLC